LARYGQDVRLGFGWSWLQPLAPVESAADFVSLSADPPLTGPEQAAYLENTRSNKTRRWVVLELLPQVEYEPLERARDISQRMLAAKLQGAEGVFVPEVYSTRQGLLNDDGTVGELFLPWRMMALSLAGAQPLGEIRLPHGSSNQVLACDDQLTMMLW